MAHRDTSSPKPLPTILRCGIAVLSIAIATGFGLFVREFEIRLTPFLFAVGATVWYAGTGPGALAIVLAVVSLDYFFVPPLYTFTIVSLADLIYLTLCTLFALIVGWVSAARRRVEQELRQARDALDAKVVERTADLSRSEGYLAEAQRLSHTGSWAWNVAVREITHWSQETYRLYGFDPKEGIPPFEALLQRVHLEDRGRLVEDLERAIREKANHEMAFRAVLPDGTIKYIHGIGHPVFNQSGDLVEFAGAATDITERKRAEYLTGHVFESSPDGMAIVGRDYRFQRVNPVHERFWQQPPGSMVGKRTAEIMGREFFEQKGKSNLDRCFAGEEISYADWFATPRGRKYRALSITPLRPDSQRVEAALVIARDLTDHMEASEALRQTQMELTHANRVTTMGQLAASIAHEVNQPIGATVNNAHAALRWLARQPPDLKEVREALDEIIKDGNRAGEVINRIRALIKNVPPRSDLLDINETILEVIALTRSEVLTNGVSLQTQLATMPLVQGDRIQLQQVMLNLIVNAIEAMSGVSKGARTLLMSTEKDSSNAVLVAVRDSGPGLDAEGLSRLFDAFYTTKPGGMGMGLSICRSIIEAHGGRIWATANVPQGAVFHFTLPVGG